MTSLRTPVLLALLLATTGVVSAQPDPFAPPRSGASGEVVKGYLPDVVATEVFKTVREAAATQADARTAKTLRALEVRYLETNGIIARRTATHVEVSYGLLHEVYARSMTAMEAGRVTAGERGMFQARVLGLIFAHEVSRAAGLRSTRAADAQAVRTIWESMLKPQNANQGAVALKETLAVFDRPTGRTTFDNLLNRAKTFIRYGTPGGRLANLERAARGEADRLARYRRADGTLRWGPLTRDGALREGAGLAKFGLALFLKELAVVAKTGDRGRIEEFFDGLATTDFYVHYGLFVAGARVSEVAYVRYLSRYVKPRFVSGILKTNLTLAAGMALPMLVSGQFETKAFAISFASLGLSSALVQAGMRGIPWVMSLKKARDAGHVARLGANAGRLVRVGGWFYTVAELAIILFVAEEVEGAVNAWLDERAARGAVADAGLALIHAARAPDSENLDEALTAYRDAWHGFRDWLYQPLHQQEAELAHRIQGLARKAKLSSDVRDAMRDRLEGHPALARHARSQSGSLDAYADAQSADGELDATVDGWFRDYDARRAELLHELYHRPRRESAYLDGVHDLLGEPAPGRTGIYARFTRSRTDGALTDTLRDASTNRLQTYEDEAELLAALATRLRNRGHTEHADALTGEVARVEQLAHADRRLIGESGGLLDGVEED